MLKELITGYISSRRVFIGSTNNERLIEITPEHSQRMHNHSPDGFAWGYAGSGPSQLALAILLRFTSDAIALQFYQDFKFDFIAPLDKDKDFQIVKRDVLAWLDKKTNS